MIYPGTGGDGGYSLGSPDDLQERKRQLVQKLLQSGARNQTGLSGLHALPLFGGRGRGSSDLPTGALPQISFNPFLAMAAGRPNEQFQAPNGVTQAALAHAQAGMRASVGAPSPQETPGGDPSAQAASSFLGAGINTPGIDGPGAVPTAAPVNENQQYLMPGMAPRHLAGGGQQPTLLPQGWIPRLGSLVAM